MAAVEIPVTNPYGRLVSISQPCDGLTARGLLRLAQGQERFYWENRRDDFALAGFGMAAELVAWGPDRFDSMRRQAESLFAGASIQQNGQALAGPRLFGGFAFQDDFVPDNTWTVYAPAYFILPHYQLAQVGDSAWLTINVHLPADEDPEELIPQLREALATRAESLLAEQARMSGPEDTAGEPLDVNYPMPYRTWEKSITDAIHRIRTTALQKVVLSRVAEIRFADHVQVDAALDYLGEHYADCYRFLFEPRPHHAFYGATPELLAQVEGRRLTTMGLAGSIRRGQTPEEDAAYAQQILNDPKERHEHALVVETLRERLDELAEQLTISDTPGILQLSNIQHLYTPVQGVLKEDLGVLPVIEQLHPTPALGGKPRDLALAFIRHAEPVPRGWYGAPIGWVDANLDGMFGVAIRSAVSQDRRVWLYAGVGIVADSVPQKEWDETALKFRPMLGALGIRDQALVR
ncbi:MAG: isochorismate synthase [Anaerolineae bacterium]|nr:isochorismate synthase [Anaerolineae bacterium]